MAPGRRLGEGSRMGEAMVSSLHLRPEIEAVRLRVASATPDEHKSQMGQYMTPAPIGHFMAGLFSRTSGRCRLIDAGAGIGSLTAAFLDRWSDSFNEVEVTAVECDPAMRQHLRITLDRYRAKSTIRPDDFIDMAVLQLKGYENRGFTHAILNPPYRKINTASRHRLTLRKVGIEAVNLYSAFTALVILLMQDKGEVVAIIPRSFCNGPYYQPFRELLVEKSAIRQVHLFGSRQKAFRDDNVLQENVIIHLEKGGIQGDVKVSVSADPSFSNYEERSYSFDQIVQGVERFIHLPTRDDVRIHENCACSLKEIDVQVSTGPVVDFRLKEFIYPNPITGTVPLLYATHFRGQAIEWPKTGKKPNAIMEDDNTRKWLYPNDGFYTVTRRFSSKEEKRRITASVCDPRAFDGFGSIAFENHLNVFHCGKRGIPERLARGLALYLNSTMIDEHFRSFNGHTQVNATDLRLLKYPDKDTLNVLGDWAKKTGSLTQQEIDEKLQQSL
jgi:adenine-specific DNA-methyltransferase